MRTGHRAALHELRRIRVAPVKFWRRRVGRIIARIWVVHRIVLARWWWWWEVRKVGYRIGRIRRRRKERRSRCARLRSWLLFVVVGREVDRRLAGQASHRWLGLERHIAHSWWSMFKSKDA